MTEEAAQAERLLDVLRLGRRDYREVHELQLELLEKRIEGAARDTLVLVEHDPVVTLGRGVKASDLGEIDLPLETVERGGEATYHGPGQVVAYMIYQLPEGRRDVHAYLRDLEEVVIRVLAEVQIKGVRRAGLTGVWIGEQKVASIGVALRRWVAWHGLALNVHTDLQAFGQFHPCGLDPSVMTRVVDHAEIPPGNLLFEVLLVTYFLEVFGLQLPPPPAPGPDPRGFPQLPILQNP